MKGKAIKAEAETVISFNLTDSEVNVCQWLQLPGNKLQRLHKIPTYSTLEVINHNIRKKDKYTKLAQLQAPLHLVMIADPFS